MRRTQKIETLFLLTMFFFLSAISHLRAQPVEIEISGGRVETLPVAIPLFEYTDKRLEGYARTITSVLEEDLRRSGVFRIINKAAYIEKNPTIDAPPRFKDWRLIKAKALVLGRISQLADGKLQAEYRLWDPLLSKQLIGHRFTAQPGNWRSMAHTIANGVYERIIGERGYFDSRIIFVDEVGSRDERKTRLAIMDHDGYNVRLLTEGAAKVQTPRFNARRQEVAYITYTKGVPKIYLIDLRKGSRKILGDFPDMTSPPRFSPDGEQIVMSLRRNGSSNIALFDLQAMRPQYLTSSQSHDVAPAFAPDGQRIVYESAKQLFVVDKFAKKPKRISRGSGSYSTPVWSPRGDQIAFTKDIDGKSLIGVMRPDGSGERLLTRSSYDKGPSWSPNGRILLFYRDSQSANSGPRLYSIDLSGRNKRKLATPSFGSDPSWAPLRE